MSKVFISGLLNIESSVNVDSFPIDYSPIEYPFFGINTSVSGVGYNIAKALKVLGDDISLVSITGDDDLSKVIRERLDEDDISTSLIFKMKEASTPESVVLVDKSGARKIFCDLKNIQSLSLLTSLKKANLAYQDYDVAILSNINFSRDLIPLFKKHHVLIASDVHVLNNIYDEYNKDFLKNSDILFLSNEACLDKEAECIKEIYSVYHNKVIVIGCGKDGALLYEGDKDKYYYQPSTSPYGVKNTVGAGDALFSSFIHYYLESKDIEKSLEFAVTFAGAKVGYSGGSNGFKSEKEILSLISNKHE